MCCAALAAGLYLAGGLGPKLRTWFAADDGPFLTAFGDKGRMTALVGRYPVYLVLEENVGRRGAYLMAYLHLYDYQQQEAAAKAKLEAVESGKSEL